MQPSVLEPACLKTSRGREGENESREARGGNLCRHHSPWGPVSVYNRVPARLSGRDCGKRLSMCEYV